MNEELLSALILALVSTVIVVPIVRYHAGWERKLIALSYAAHLASAVGQVWITRWYYGYGDMITYHGQGIYLARLMRMDFAAYAPEVLRELFHQESDLPYHVFGSGASTGSMSALSGFLCLGLWDSLYAICITAAFLSFLGKLALYHAFREHAPAGLRMNALVACLLVPSVVFWSSGLLKETFAVAGLGVAVLGLWRLRRGSVVRPAALIVSGSVLVGMFKAYMLFPLAIAWGIWLYWRRVLNRRPDEPVRIRPVRFLLAGALSIAALASLSTLFPKYSVDTLADHTASLQEIGSVVEGGSNYALVETPRSTISSQLAYAPVALLTALFRPSIFEVRNAIMFVNSLETSAISAILLWAILRGRLRGLWEDAKRSAPLMFSLSFSLVTAVAVGLASTNLGSLSRYRIPFMPFFVFLVLAAASRKPGLGARRVTLSLPAHRRGY